MLETPQRLLAAMPSRTIDVAVIGLGRISDRHFAAINDPETPTRLVAVCDTLHSVAEQVGLAQGVDHFTSIDDMLREHPNIGLIVICTPSGSHYQIAMDLIPSRIPLLIEKPLTLSTRQALDLVGSSGAMGVPVFVVKQNRLNPPVLEARRRLDSGELGRLLSAVANVTWCRPVEYYLQDPWRLTREMDGGVVWNQASHYVDLLVNLLDPIVSVDAMGANFLSPSEAEDTVHAVMQSSTGQIATLIATTTARPRNFEGSLTLVSESGVLKVGGHALNELEADSTRSTLVEEQNLGQERDVDSVYGNGHIGVYQQVTRDLLQGVESEFRSERGIPTVALIEAIHLSIEHGRRVFLEEVLSGSRDVDNGGK
jgi:UDP-N-acetyl-2-amino-2-deoxyglucuronate dehydrogenase